MQRKQILTSVLAGVLTGLAQIPLIGLLTASNPVRFTFLGASVLFSIGVSLWPPIDPVIYSVTLAATLFAVPFSVVALGGWGNLGGLAAIALAGMGVLTGGSAVLFGSGLRKLNLSRWAGPVMAMMAVIGVLGVMGWSAEQGFENSSNLLDAIEKIRHAELAYAAGSADHAFTCNGPDLPGFEHTEWQTDPQMKQGGVTYKNQAQIAGRVIYMRCDPSARSRWVDIVAKNLYSGNEEARGRVER